MNDKDFVVKSLVWITLIAMGFVMARICSVLLYAYQHGFGLGAFM